MPTVYRERTMDALTLRLLGPMQLHVDGVPVALGGPRRRALLAYLVVHRETPVPAERIIAELWGPDAEEGARATRCRPTSRRFAACWRIPPATPRSPTTLPATGSSPTA